MYKDQIEADLKRVARELGFVAPADTVVYIPENSSFGDYSTNIALQLSKQKHKDSYQNPLEIANKILEKLGHPDYLERIEIAGPGFLNFYLKDDALVSVLTISKYGKEVQLETAPKYLVEYGDPKTHKMLHLGHLVPLVLGESISRLLEYSGGIVTRVNYGSDIGLTVGKCLWGVERLKSEYEAVKSGDSLREKAEFLGKAYSLAHKSYTENPETKTEIDELTKKIYQRDPEVLPIWEETTLWSLAYFDSVYALLGIEFDRRINESEVETLGKEIVLKNIGKVFKEDQGAVIFPGEKYGLHNRVFLNSAGNPTYEAKDLGLTEKYFELGQFNEILSLAHREQNDYFKVVLKANKLLFGEEGGKRKHLSFGELRLTTGKMSSREGNAIPAEDMIDTAVKKLAEIAPHLPQSIKLKIASGAIKFWLLKYSVNSDIIFDLEKSISLQGDSGPYVLYVYARIASILNRAKENKAGGENTQAQKDKIAQPARIGYNVAGGELEPQERELLRQLEYFELISEKAAKNLQPNEITTYLLNLAKSFNSFYESCPILVSDKKAFRLKLIKKTAELIKLGLYLLGIETVDKM